MAWLALTAACTQDGRPQIDGSVAVMVGGLVRCLPQDRVSRKKHDGGVQHALEMVTSDLGLGFDDFERIFVTTSGENAPSNAPVPLRTDGRLTLQDLGFKDSLIEWTPSHHENHAFEALFAARNAGALETPALVVVVDRVGHLGEHQSAYLFDGRVLRLVDRPTAEVGMIGGYGLAYDRVTAHLGWRENVEAGKTMALAGCGAPLVDMARFFFEAKARPRFLLPSESSAANAVFSRWVREHEFGERMGGGANLAAQLQFELEASLVAWMRPLVERFRPGCILFGGGFAANCKAIGAVASAFPLCAVQGSLAPNDAGQPIGALVRAHFLRHRRLPRTDPFGGFWIAHHEARITAWSPFNGERAVIADMATAVLAIAKGGIVEIQEAPCEPGPRALGFHSYLCDARRADTAAFLARTKKKREPFRPFGALMAKQTFQRYFGGRSQGPFMDLALPVSEAFADRYPACVHVDRTCRIQTLGPWHVGSTVQSLLSSLCDYGSDPVLVNTSLNEPGEPLRVGIDFIA